MAGTRSRSLAGMGYTGYPAAIFIERMNYGYGNRSHMENKISLEKWYSALYNHLPVLYGMEQMIILGDEGIIADEYYKPDWEESTVKQKEFWDKILPRLNDVEIEINAMGKKYDSKFENKETCDPQEIKFILLMRGCFERLDHITAIAHIIDGIKPESEDVNF